MQRLFCSIVLWKIDVHLISTLIQSLYDQPWSSLYMINPDPVSIWSTLIQSIYDQPWSSLYMINPDPVYIWSTLIQSLYDQPWSSLYMINPDPVSVWFLSGLVFWRWFYVNQLHRESWETPARNYWTRQDSIIQNYSVSIHRANIKPLFGI